jgi:signal transduction histidine kinase
MTSLVDSLLALARFDAGTDGERRELVNLESISQECLKSVQPLADERGVKLSAIWSRRTAKLIQISSPR